MAKPYEEYAGSGMHVHISMLDAADHNAFACDDGSDSLMMKCTLAGMLHGLDTQLPLPQSVTGNGHHAEGLALPIRQSDALYEFDNITRCRNCSANGLPELGIAAKIMN